MVELKHGGKTSLQNKVSGLKWKDNFRMSRKRFYELNNILRPYVEKKRTHLSTPISVEAQVGSF